MLLDRRVRRLSMLRGAGQTLLSAAICAAAGMGFDLVADPTTAIRVGVFLTSTAVVLFMAWQTLVRTWRSQITIAELAAVVERQYPQLGEQLLSAVEVEDEAKPERFRGSPHMRALIRRDALEAIKNIDFRAAVSPKRAIRWGLAGSAAVALLLVPFAIAARDYALLWERFLSPWEQLDHVIGYEIEVAELPAFAARGSDLVVRARISRRGLTSTMEHEPVILQTTDEAGRQSDRSMELDPGAAEFVGRLPQVALTFDFRVMAGRSLSDLHHVEVVDRPAVTQLSVEVRPPAYTQSPSSSVDNVPSSIHVVEGTELRFRATFNKSLERAVMLPLDGGVPPVPFHLAENKLSGELKFVPVSSGRFAVALTDTQQLTHQDQAREIVVIPDKPPTLVVSIGDGSGPLSIRSDDTLRVSVHAADDFGIATLDLVAELPGGSNQTVLANPTSPDRRLVSTVLEWNLAPLKLAEGSAVKFRVRARDNRPTPSPNETWSATHLVLIDRNALPNDGDPVARRQDQLKQQLAEIRISVEKTRGEIARRRTGGDSSESSAIEIPRDDWSRLVREQTDIAGRLQGLALELAERPLFTRMADEARDIAEQEIRAASRLMAGASGALPPEKNRATNEAVEHLGNARDKLAALEQRFDELAATERDLLRLPQLAQRTEALAAATRVIADRQPTKPSESSNHEETKTTAADKNVDPLRTDRQQLSRDVESLLNEHTALLDAARRIQIDRLAEFARTLELLTAREELLGQAIEADANAPSERDFAEAENAARLQIDLQMLVRPATRAATEILNRAGGDAPWTKTAVDIARQVDNAARQAWAGNLSQSGMETAQAAASARTLVTALQTDEESATYATTTQQLTSLAARLEEIAKSTAKLGELPAARKAARSAGQLMLKQQTTDVARGLQQIAESLGEEPLRLDAIHESAHQSDLATRAAGEQMEQASQSIQNNERLAAMNAATKAIAELREAARWARDGAAAGQGIAASSPENIAGPLAEAARHLQQAGRELSQQGNTQNGRGAERNQNSAEEDARAEAEAAGRQNALSRSANALDRSARALTEAANNAKRGGMPQPGSDTGANSAGSSESTTLSGSAGTGAWGLRDVESLDAELERHASREWGSVPQPVRTQIHEPGRDIPRGEYSGAIERYFRELAGKQ